MPVPEDSPNARFSFYVYRSPTDENPSEEFFSSQNEMDEHVQRLGKNGNFYRIVTYRYEGGDYWEPLAEFVPEDFEEDTP
ncbi:MAG: hypothetical protein JJU07_11135 [Natronohydrobacter sp.]|nr:hypothetical protein [Natronohydrobacter sp.]